MLLMIFLLTRPTYALNESVYSFTGHRGWIFKGLQTAELWGPAASGDGFEMVWRHHRCIVGDVVHMLHLHLAFILECSYQWLQNADKTSYIMPRIPFRVLPSPSQMLKWINLKQKQIKNTIEGEKILHTDFDQRTSNNQMHSNERKTTSPPSGYFVVAHCMSQ